MAYAVVHSDEGSIPEEGEGSSANGDGCERCAHAGPLGEADTVDVGRGDACCGEGRAREGDEVSAVVGGCVFGKEACSWGGDECVTEVGEDFCLGWRVEDDAYAEFVGRAFAPEGDVGCFRHGV